MTDTATNSNLAHPAPPTRARRIPARDLITAAQLAEVRTRSTWRGLAMIAHAWLVILAAVALVAVYPHPLAVLAAIVIIGSRQLGLAILMHDGAHGAFSTDARTNLALAQWFCAYPVLAETQAYRKYHLQHHAHTQTEDDPDLILSAPFPITQASYRRKFWRDLTGQTGYQQRRAQLINAWGPTGGPAGLSPSARMRHLIERLGPQVAVNGVIAAIFTSAVGWWAYPALWIAPLVTWFMVITRIRNIAEHAVVPDSTDPLRNTRTTDASWIERALVAPYFVNYHLEHHLFFYVPAYNLPRLHRILMQGPHAARMEVQPSYWRVMALALAKPAHEDRPGAVVSNVRRQASGAGVDENSARSGF
jgi:fatty acid desaturase